MTGNVVLIARDDEQVRGHLDALALRGGTTLAQVRPYASVGCSDDALWDAWIDFLESTRAWDELCRGRNVWSTYYDPEDCSGQEHAIELKHAEADDAFRRLRCPR